MLLRITIAVLLGVVVLVALDYIGLLSHAINALIGILVGLVYFASAR